LSDYLALCENGQVRLIGGSNYGRVEVCVSREWGTICSDQYWDDVDAGVICNQLGYLRNGRKNCRRTSLLFRVVGIKWAPIESLVHASLVAINTLAGTTVKPALVTTCIQKPPLFKDHCGYAIYIFQPLLGDHLHSKTWSRRGRFYCIVRGRI
jgi:hypothetical protein